MYGIANQNSIEAKCIDCPWATTSFNNRIAADACLKWLCLKPLFYLQQRWKLLCSNKVPLLNSVHVFVDAGYPWFLILKETLSWFIGQFMHHLHAVPQVLFEVIEYIFLWSIKQSFKFVHMRKLFMMNQRVTIQVWIASKNQVQNFPTALQVLKTS